MSNQIEESEFPVLKMTLDLRHHLLDVLTDEDLVFSLPGNPSLGALCRQMGEVEQAYIKSFKTFSLTFDYQHDDPEVERNVAKLRTWFAEMEQNLKTILSHMTDEDINNKTIQRADGFAPPVRVQFHIYREGLLIFYAKISVYLNALERSVSDQWAAWIG